MKKLDLENKEIVIGKFSIMSDSLKGMTKEKFDKLFSNHFLGNTSDAWKICKPFAKVEKPKTDK